VRAYRFVHGLSVAVELPRRGVGPERERGRMASKAAEGLSGLSDAGEECTPNWTLIRPPNRLITSGNRLPVGLAVNR
jgi:hypothetical protein